MKSVIDLIRAIGDEKNFDSQFLTRGYEKNILFVNPQLSNKHFYKMILPFFTLRSKDQNGIRVKTAITTISKYDPEGQLLGGREVEINEKTKKMYQWADYIVFPFTTQPLVSEVYAFIREVNPSAKIMYQIDFDYYNMPDYHPYKYIFDEPTVMTAVQDNILFADLAVVSNLLLYQYFEKKLQSVFIENYSKTDMPPNSVGLVCIPIYVDSEICLSNVDYEFQKPISISAEKNSSNDKEDVVKNKDEKPIEKVETKEEKKPDTDLSELKNKTVNDKPETVNNTTESNTNKIDETPKKQETLSSENIPDIVSNKKEGVPKDLKNGEDVVNTENNENIVVTNNISTNENGLASDTDIKTSIHDEPVKELIDEITQKSQEVKKKNLQRKNKKNGAKSTSKSKRKTTKSTGKPKPTDKPKSGKSAGRPKNST